MQKLFSSALIYTFLSFLQGFIGLLLQPLYTQYFSNSDYAIFSLLNSLGALLGSIATLNMGSTLFTFYYNYADDRPKLQLFLGQIVSSCLLSGALLLSISAICGDAIFNLVFKDAAFHFFPDGLIAFLTGILANILVPYMALLRNDKNIRAFAYVSLWSVGLGLSLQWFAIVGLHAGVSGALIGRCLGNGIVALYVLYQIRDTLTFSLQKEYLRAPFLFAIYLLLNNVLEWLTAYNDRFFIERWFNTALLGTYSLLNTLTATIEMGYWAVTMAIQPFLFENLKSHQTANIRTLYRFYLSVTWLIISGVVFLISHLEYFGVDSSYLSIKPYCFLYALAYSGSALGSLVSLHFHYEKNARVNFYRTLVMVICSLLLNAYLAPKYGLWACVIAALVARFATLSILLVWKPVILHYITRPLVAFMLGGIGVLLLAHYFCQQAIYSANVLGTLQLLCIIGLVGLFNKDSLMEYLSSRYSK